MATYNGTTGADTYTGTADADVINGLGGNDVLNGAAGNDVIDGGVGADTMTGGLGDDTFYIDNAGDLVREAKNQGYDTVYASVTFSLAGQFVEALHLTGTATIDATGNTLDNALFGNSAANVLDGYSGNDVLDGGAGADTMKGGNGDDTFYVDNAGDTLVEAKSDGYDIAYSSVSYALSANVEELHLTGAALNATGNASDNVITGTGAANVLDGGAGADHLAGGLGNDTYVVDNAGDVVTEDTNAGTDLVLASVSTTLGANVENLTLTGSADINGTGNELANTITGNAGNNILEGGAGADRMIGGAGNDTYIVDNAADGCKEVDGGGSDTVKASVSYSIKSEFIEQLILTGGGDTNATGNTLDNVLIGNNGANILAGGQGSDSLVGAGGADTFLFGRSDFTGASSGAVDRITDFVHAQNDKIDLSGIDAVAGGTDDAFTFIGANGFSGTAGELRYEQTTDSYGLLTGDVTGDGVADITIRIDGAPNFVNGDFVL